MTNGFGEISPKKAVDKQRETCQGRKQQPLRTGRGFVNWYREKVPLFVFVMTRETLIFSFCLFVRLVLVCLEHRWSRRTFDEASRGHVFDNHVAEPGLRQEGRRRRRRHRRRLRPVPAPVLRQQVV